MAGDAGCCGNWRVTFCVIKSWVSLFLFVFVGDHEEAHTYQYQVLGIFYAPVYMLSGGFVGPDGYTQAIGNSLENAAQDYGMNKQGQNWWPW